MGRTARLTLRLENLPPNTPGKFPLFENVSESGIVTLLGDTIELNLADAKVDTVKSESGHESVEYKIPVQVFDSGKYVIPSIIYVSGADTLRSNMLSLEIIPVAVTADAEISPDAGVVVIPASAWQKFTDKLPDFIYFYWWLILLLVIIVVAAIILWRKFRKTGVHIYKKPEPTPYEIAVRALENLRARKLWENGQEREYFTELTEILRNYLYGRFGINAMEMTTEQILNTISSQEDVKGKEDYVRRILSVADFVKFAKMRPLPDDNIDAYTNALRFIEETKPAVAYEGNTKPAGKEGKNV